MTVFGFMWGTERKSQKCHPQKNGRCWNSNQIWKSGFWPLSSYTLTDRFKSKLCCYCRNSDAVGILLESLSEKSGFLQQHPCDSYILKHSLILAFLPNEDDEQPKWWFGTCTNCGMISIIKHTCLFIWETTFVCMCMVRVVKSRGSYPERFKCGSYLFWVSIQVTMLFWDQILIS